MMTLAGRVNTLFFALILFALVTIIAMLAAGVRGGPLDPTGPPGSTASVRLPGTPISSGPTTITQPGHYYLTNDINVSGAVTAILITANNVSLDLGGFTIDGTDTAGSVGISTTSSFSARIEHGTVRDFQVAVSTWPAEGSRIDDIVAISNIRGLQIGARSIISNCMSVSNTETGIVVLEPEAQVRDCLVVNNDEDGIYVAGRDATIEDTTVSSIISSWDINIAATGTGARIRNNNFSNLRVGAGFTKVVDNVCAGSGNSIIIAEQSLTQYVASATDPHANFGCTVFFP